MSNLHVINDDNYQTIIAEGLAAGRATGFEAGPPMDPRFKFSNKYTIIPRKDWPALIKQGQGTFLSDLIKAAKIPSKDQDGLGYCWVYASTSTVETCRAIQGQHYVDLSPESVGGPVTGWRNQGGYGEQALDQLTKVGACEMSFMDRPNSLSPSRWKAGWEADRENYKITMSWFEVETFEEVMTALFLRMPVSIGLNWWRHQVLLTDPYMFDTGKFGVVMRNSWGEDWPSEGAGGWSTLTESKTTPSSSFAAINVTTFDAGWHGDHTVDSLALVNHHQELVRKAIEKAGAK